MAPTDLSDLATLNAADIAAFLELDPLDEASDTLDEASGTTAATEDALQVPENLFDQVPPTETDVVPKPAQPVEPDVVREPAQPIKPADPDDYTNVELYIRKHRVERVKNEDDPARIEYVVSNLKKFQIHLDLRDRSSHERVFRKLDIEATVVYESNDPVVRKITTQPLLKGATRATICSKGNDFFGELDVQMGVEVLSKKHRGQRFRIVVTPQDDALKRKYPHLKVVSQPMRSVTKVPPMPPTAHTAGTPATKPPLPAPPVTPQSGSTQAHPSSARSSPAAGKRPAQPQGVQPGSPPQRPCLPASSPLARVAEEDDEILEELLGASVPTAPTAREAAPRQDFTAQRRELPHVQALRKVVEQNEALKALMAKELEEKKALKAELATIYATFDATSPLPTRCPPAELA